MINLRESLKAVPQAISNQLKMSTKILAREHFNGIYCFAIIFLFCLLQNAGHYCMNYGGVNAKLCVLCFRFVVFVACPFLLSYPICVYCGRYTECLSPRVHEIAFIMIMIQFMKG